MVKANVQKEEAANLFQRVLGTAANMTECKKDDNTNSTGWKIETGMIKAFCFYGGQSSSNSFDDCLSVKLMLESYSVELIFDSDTLEYNETKTNRCSKDNMIAV